MQVIDLTSRGVIKLQLEVFIIHTKALSNSVLRNRNVLEYGSLSVYSFLFYFKSIKCSNICFGRSQWFIALICLHVFS